MSGTSLKLPSKSPITLPFGATTAPYDFSNPHLGVDFAHIPDNQIYAPFSGKVTLVPNNGRDGNGIYMTDTNGDFHGMLHSSQYLVANGANVNEGQPIAIMGETGFAQGVHLHWCIKRNGVFIDPMSLINEGENMTRGVMSALAFLAIRRNEVTDDEFNKYQNDVEGFVQYLTAVQSEHAIAPQGYSAGTVSAFKQVATRQDATNDEIAKYLTDMPGLAAYLRAVQDEHGLNPQSSASAADLAELSKWQAVKALLKQIIPFVS